MWPARSCLSALRLELKEPEGTAMQGRLTVMAKTVENILRAQDEEAFLELYSALSACSKISELALKGGISELSIRVSYLVRFGLSRPFPLCRRH